MADLGYYDIGDRPIITATFADITGGAAVATVVTFIVKTPNGTETSYPAGHADVTNPSTNVWKLQMPTLAEAGRHAIRTKSTSSIVAAEEATLTVRASRFASP